MTKPKTKTRARAKSKLKAKSPGRPSDYRPEYCAIAAEACSRGATGAELADLLGVVRSTVGRWCLQFEEFRIAVQAGRECADQRVEYALYERCVGYRHMQAKVVQSEEGLRVIKYEEELPPDLTAIKYWLGNRQPEKWRDRTSKEITGPNGGAIEVKEISDLETARQSCFLITRMLLGLPAPEGTTMRPDIGWHACLYLHELKQQWHRQALERLADLAKALGIKQYQRRSLKGGSVYSGEVTLQSPTLSIRVSQGEGVAITACRAGRSVGHEHYARLHELDDIAALLSVRLWRGYNIGYDDFDFDFGQKAHGVLGTAVNFGVALLAAITPRHTALSS